LRIRRQMPSESIGPSLKSASGAGFSFEDKTAALLLCEMLAGQLSLGERFGIIQQVERQAGDWEPFGDLLLTVPNSAGILVKCGGSVKSNRRINANGCDEELRDGLWSATSETVFAPDNDTLALFSAPLSPTVRERVHTLCRQAREMDPNRLDEKVIHGGIRRIYESFRHQSLAGVQGLPGAVLARFFVREFDFEAPASRDTAEALRLCREALSVEAQDETIARALWSELLSIAEGLRISGGVITREGLSTKLRLKFGLRDDPCDTSAWARIRHLSREGMEEIATALPGGVELPRTGEQNALRTALAESRACYVLGESGSGKSAIVKTYAAEIEAGGTEVIWVRADRFAHLLAAVPQFLEVARRTRRSSALLIIDAVEGCYTSDSLSSLARTVAVLTTEKDSLWSVILTCQTAEWARVTSGLVKELTSHPVLAKRVECGGLAQEDFDLLCAASPSAARLAKQAQLRLLLSSPKMVDVLLTGQLAEGRSLAGEADLVEWWWEQQVRGSKPIAAEETVARQIANRMADELCSEVQPDSVTGAEEAASALIRNRVLQRTREGLLRFDHELLADWSRLMHLKALGKQALLPFIRGHIQNPPWLRAVRLLSQHLLDRVEDLGWWREVLEGCSVVEQPHQEASAENLQVIDAWLEGIIFSIEPARVLERVRDELFADEGWLLRRLVRRLMYVGTVPDPVIQERFRQMDASTAEAAGTRYRLPIWSTWSPIVRFLVAHSQEAIDTVPVELGEIAAMWARMEEYLKITWTALADLVLANAEKELRQEVSGDFGGRDKSRTIIYTGALHAASQHPDRAVKLVLKAAGRAPWEDGDLGQETDSGWRGEWEEPQTMFFEESYVEMPLASWPIGPTRKTSREFFHAWFDSAAGLSVYRRAPDVSCEATLGFLLSWPKRTLRQGEHHGSEIDHYGFTFEADHFYPAFYTKGPFLIFLRENWRPALDLITRLVNFATERYADWWPYDSQPTNVTFSTSGGEASWLGNHQIYAWNRYNMNTTQVVTCALMALEKWLEEQIEKGESIAQPVQALYQQGNSLAFAGVLIAVGKRHPELFSSDLKPLLFVREIYMHDMRSVIEGVGSGYSQREGEFMNNLRREWETLPGRKTSLLDACCDWLLNRPELRSVLTEVSTKWRNAAGKLPSGSQDAIELLRWASNFDFSYWKEVTLPDGQKGWQHKRPEELRDMEAEQAHRRQQALLTLPYQCSEMLNKRQILAAKQVDAIWQQLSDWQSLVDHTPLDAEENELSSSFLDDRHSHAGLIAVLLCLGGDWLDSYPGRRQWVENELRKLLADQPKGTFYTAEDSHHDYEGFLARSVIQCWAHSPNSAEWRGVAGNFVTAFRYRTIEQLFDEAFRVREALGNGFRELEALALTFAVVRRQAKLNSFQPKPELVNKWCQKWLPKFANSHGPKWTNEWKNLAVKEAYPPSRDPDHGRTGRKERRRRDFGFDMGVLLAAFGCLPTLSEAHDADERAHWLHICREFLGAYVRTLPPDDVCDGKDEWRLEMWSADKKILDLVAARLFQCSSSEQQGLWLPILNLPPAAHYHITGFLSDVLIEAIRTDPPRIADLVPLWRAMAEHLFDSPRWNGKLQMKQDEVWQHIFLYGTPFSSVGDKDHAPLVLGLRDLFERHIKTLGADPYDQSSLAAFLTTEAGEQLLVDALEWLWPSWRKAKKYFWQTVVERSNFETLLRRAWRRHFEAIRARPNTLKSFKILTLNLASEQVSIALEVQRQIGNQ
jgi:hypothetical protein